MVSMGLAVIMLMSVPGESILFYAMTGREQDAQKPAAESGQYVFEVRYDSVPDDNGVTEITEEQAVEGRQEEIII